MQLNGISLKLTLSLTALFLLGCSDVRFAEAPLNSVGGTEETLKTIQPALAVRGIACLLCHAQIHSNIITDFGLGTNWFMGGDAHFDNDQNWFTNLASTWQSAQTIEGSVYVPNVQVTRNAQNGLGPDFTNAPLVKLAAFLELPYYAVRNFDEEPSQAGRELAMKVHPEPGKARVVEKSQVVIRAPSESEISNLAPSLWQMGASPAGAKRIGSVASIQLNSSTGENGKKYLRNDASIPLDCRNADIVVRGTLYLKNFKVKAAGGCRLYVSGTVFIEGDIEYIESGENPNLQITSASAISMGISKTWLNYRLLEDSRGLQLEVRDYNTLANQVVAEATTVGGLKDAVDDYSPRASIEYRALLLNAPIVHSRYLGLVHGTIIAEAALFALGEFHFAFDDVFTKVSVLPLLAAPVLLAK